MKKAYVKPVFVAELYEISSSVAACYTQSMSASDLELGLHICEGGNCNHNVGGVNPNGKLDPQAVIGNGEYSTGVTYWEYAGATVDDKGNVSNVSECKLFNSMDTACDFVWNNTADPLHVWSDNNNRQQVAFDNSTLLGSILRSVGNFGEFFYGASANGAGHRPAIFDTIIPS